MARIKVPSADGSTTPTKTFRRNEAGEVLNKDGTVRAKKRDIVFILTDASGNVLFVYPEGNEARWVQNMADFGKIAFDYPSDKFIHQNIKIINAPPTK